MLTRSLMVLALTLGTALLAACHDTGQRAAVMGYVEVDWIVISAPDAGRIVEHRVRPGVMVEPGDLLFRLDGDAQAAELNEAQARVRQFEAEARDLGTGARPAEIKALEARLSEAEARLVRAQADSNRILPLVGQGVESRARADQAIAEVEIAKASVEAVRRDITVAREAARPANREAAEARIESAQAALAAAVYRLEQRTVRAAVRGRVEEVFLDESEFATAAAPVLAIIEDGSLKVRFFVPQGKLAGLESGGTVSIRADGLPSPVEATITYIAAQPEYTPPVIYTQESRQKLVFAVDARLPVGTAALPGLPVEVEL